MKKLLTVTNGTQFFRGICGSALLILAAVLFSIAFWLSGPTVRAAAPTPTATPDFTGASDPSKCTICHVPPGNPNNPQTLTVGCSAVDAHMRNHPGDCMG